MKLLSQGAESKIYLIEKNGAKFILKERFSKNYRISEIDNMLIKRRMKSEIKILKSVLVSAPKFISKVSDNSFLMEFIEGVVLKDVLEDNLNLSFEIGKLIAKLHDSNIIHSDLTTSNFIYGLDAKLYLIDFGLSFFSNRFEDKAVDIHLFKQAIISKHYSNFDKIYNLFLEGYSKCSDYEQVMSRLSIVESRGRNKIKGV